MFPLLLFLLFNVAHVIDATATNKVVCYYGTWAKNRKGNGKLDVEKVDTEKCTHVVYAFVGLNYNASIKILDSDLAIKQEYFTKFNKLKKKNPKLKTLLAIGGANERSAVFSNIANNGKKVIKFARSAVDIIKLYDFDGFDLNWEYPGTGGGKSYDKENWERLLKTLRHTFDAGDKKFLLTATVAGAKSSIQKYYDVDALDKYLDFINVMAYDFHEYSDGVTGQNAPLYASSLDTSSSAKELNVDSSIKAWIKSGVSASKLVLGVAAFGKTFTLTNKKDKSLGAPALNYVGGDVGQHTQETGLLGYNEICEQQLLGGWTEEWDDEQKVPFMHKNDQWVGFDNTKSIKLKVEYAVKQELAGVMLWSIEYDDPNAACGPHFPILTTIKEVLDSNAGDSREDSAEVDKSEEEPSPVGSKCEQEGYMRDPKDCNIFYECVKNDTRFDQYQFICPTTLVFSIERNYCDYKSNVKC